ncbi:restriction endonuclease subunit S [Streptococcus equinus]|uniref:restriction endonuclease subunit S n=1 Tax=Streptococcus equinus TaxID=1335 RepID=UPI001E307C49|nr:restriction endonuclease subunit S [Streptococcus equinus]
MIEKKKAPKLRFPGFTNDWEQRKLGEVTEISKGVQRGKQEISEIQTSENPYPVYNGGQDVSGFTDEYNRENKVMVSEGGASAGYVNYFSDRYWSGGHNFTIDNLDNDLYFIKSILDANQQKLYGLKVGSGLPNIQLGAIKNFDIYIPSIDEQIKIGSFFATIDSLITLHQRKLKHTKDLKKSMLQKMFPKKGEKNPEIRFPGFTDDWEQRKFGDVGSVAMCKRIFKEQTSDEGDVPFYKIGTFGGTPDAYISRELFDEYKKTYQYPRKGDILISASGSIGRTVEYTGEDEYFQDSNIVWLKHGSDIDNAFLKVLYSVVKWSCEGSTIKRLYNDNFLKTEFMLPDIEEQIKIGEYFNQLDHLITLHQRELEHLKLLKKGLLQQMFI